MRTSTKIPGFRSVGTTGEPAFVTLDMRVRIRQVSPRKWAVQSSGGRAFEVSGRDAAIREARRLALEVAAEDVRVLEAGKKALSRLHATKKKSTAQLDREIASALVRSQRGDRVLADLTRWGIDREQLDEVRQAFRSGNHRKAIAIARDLGWNRSSKRGRSGVYP
jgi:hypothetical protein